ncbi:MAG: purine-nucleoside phosphorylase [Alphaproteobacteria bacterium]
MSAGVEDKVTAAVSRIGAAKSGFKPRIGLVLGSGLGGLADKIEDVSVVPFAELAGFPEPSVAGHGGEMLLGHLGGQPVACLRGRAHYYEHGRADAMKVPVRALQGAGCEILFLTNAAGSTRLDMGPGSLMMLTDHINFSGNHPLIGETGNDRFVSLSEVYDAQLRQGLSAAAASLNMVLHEGVYMWFSGPSFETPAEIRMAQILGADGVGMSTVPEAILARHCGMAVVAVSNITNLAAGLSDEELSHAQTLEMSKVGAAALADLVPAFLGTL